MSFITPILPETVLGASILSDRRQAVTMSDSSSSSLFALPVFFFFVDHTTSGEYDAGYSGVVDEVALDDDDD